MESVLLNVPETPCLSAEDLFTPSTLLFHVICFALAWIPA